MFPARPPTRMTVTAMLVSTLTILMCLQVCASRNVKSKTHPGPILNRKPLLGYQDMKQYQFAMKYYSDFFRTPQEQKAYATKFFDTPLKPVKVKQITVTSNSSAQVPRAKYTATGSTSNEGVTHYLDESDYHHGCCVSRRKFISPHTAICYETGVELEVIHWWGNRQYFLSEDCFQIQNCSDCGCRQEHSVYKAMVKINKYPWMAARCIRILGCCKCLNGLN